MKNGDEMEENWAKESLWPRECTDGQ